MSAGDWIGAIVSICAIATVVAATIIGIIEEGKPRP